jgi:hypothetical protein
VEVTGNLTNHSRWGTWIPQYLDALIYTNGLTTNNVTDIRVLWTDRAKKSTFQEKDIYQGMPDLWDGKHYISLSLAKINILSGQRLHVLLLVQDNSTSLTSLLQSSNIVYNASGIMYKIIEIPNYKPMWMSKDGDNTVLIN